MKKKSIRLFWFGGKSNKTNYGNSLSRVVVERLSGRPVTFASISTADLAAIGSIFHRIIKHQWRRPLRGRLHPLIVWGSGSIRTKRGYCSPLIEVRAVRGPLTRDLAGLPKSLALGDPGLLAPVVFDAIKRSKEYEIGIIPHVFDFGNPQVSWIHESLKDSKVIDLTNPDIEFVTKQIAACEFILSSSLHGLIAADAFGIPNARIKISNNVAGGDWKFMDYFDSVGRVDGLPVDIVSAIREKSVFDILGGAKEAVVSDVANGLMKEFAAINV